MSERDGLGEFLRTRRARVNPADAGLRGSTGRRQTPGLRREELAALAGVSVDYYTRLEQGRATNPGRSVLDALAAALQLNDDELAHLHSLVRDPASPPARATTVRPGLRHLLAAVCPAPAYVLDPISNILASNPEGVRLLAGLEEWPAQRHNIIRYVFTHPSARELFASWLDMAKDCVAHLRATGSAHGSPELSALVTELSDSSPDFADLWRNYDVRVKRGSRRRFQHPAVGPMTLTSEVLSAVDGQRFVAFQAEPDSPDHDALKLLSLTGVWQGRF